MPRVCEEVVFDLGLRRGSGLRIRALVSIAVVAILLGAAAWSVWALPRAPWLPMPPAGRLVLAVSIALSLLAAAGWVYFVLPAYWD